MKARLFQVTFEPSFYRGVEDTVELLATTKEEAIRMVKEAYRVNYIVYVTSNRDEFIPMPYCNFI